MEVARLFTVMILTYKHTQFLFEALDSVFEQDYPNIQLIISNDCSEEFEIEMIRAYCERHKKNNISKILVNKNECILGTVKHANRVLKMASGAYYMFLACDDALYDATVLSSFAKEFERLGNEALIITSQCALYDQTLQYPRGLALTDYKIAQIKSKDNELIFTQLMQTDILPAASTCYRKEFYSKYGYYNERYFIIGDFVKFAELLLNNGAIYFLDIVATKHRYRESISDTSNRSHAYKMFIKDLLQWYDEYAIPNLGLLSKGERNFVFFNYCDFQHIYHKKFEAQDQTFTQNLLHNFSKFERVRIFASVKWKLLTLIKKLTFNNTILLVAVLTGITALTFIMLSNNATNLLLLQCGLCCWIFVTSILVLRIGYKGMRLLGRFIK